PMWQKTTAGFLGRTLRTERPGNGGAILATENEYNEAGQLVSTTTTNQEPGTTNLTSVTLFAYDDFGQQTLQALDLNGNGQIDLATDRVTSNATAFVQIGGDWFSESRSYTFPEENAATPLLVSTQRQRLTGLGQSGTLGLLTA